MSVFLTVSDSRIMKKLLFAAFSLLVASAAMAQQKVVADKIVGIVGDKIILKSEIFIANEDH